MKNGEQLKTILQQFHKDYPKEFKKFRMASMSDNTYEMLVRFTHENDTVIYKYFHWTNKLERVRLNGEGYIYVR